MNCKPRFSPTICLTHSCNLNCVYCYQEHDHHLKMNFETAKVCIDWIFDNVPDDMCGIEIGFIGGEPLLEFELIRRIVEYTETRADTDDYIFYATTNGTILTKEMKEWFFLHKNTCVLGLSLDGTPETHNHNRSNSFYDIDINFFIETWPDQGVKMTLSEHSLAHLAEGVKYIHALGFKEINGVNLFEGSFDWGQEKYIEILIPQLEEMVAFYEANDHLQVNQMLNRRIELLEEKNRDKRKWCGIGTGAIFFDVDGTRLPCPFCSPMTFDKETIEKLKKFNYMADDEFIDEKCFNECYIYPVCPHCSAANFLAQGTFKVRDKSKCRIQKLITLYAADLEAKRLIKNHQRISDSELYYKINAIENIRELYLHEFESYF